jgi:hypothetical protein
LKQRILFAVLALICALPILAADKPTTGEQTISGHLVDLACAAQNSVRPDPKFGTTHEKSCLQMADCEKSGYGVLTSDNKILKFDSKGNDQAKKFIQMINKDKDWKVTVSGPVQGNTIAVNSLMLQK